jgi:hypothetical protein
MISVNKHKILWVKVIPAKELESADGVLRTAAATELDDRLELAGVDRTSTGDAMLDADGDAV